ncbi:MAG TPA: TonB family protein [Polyangiaceae bacterium]
MRSDLSRYLGACLAFALLLLATPLPVHAEETPQPEIAVPARLGAEPVPYPAGAEGDAVVVLEIEIEKDGTVGNVVVKEGLPPFDEAARLAARAWRFTPATRNGLPIRARVLAKIAFHAPAPPTAETHPTEPTPRTSEPDPSAPFPERPVEPIEVTVVGERREELGSTHIPRNETRLIPGAFADPFRVVEVMPGVAPILSGIPYFTVRGAPPGSVGYAIDGIRVPILFHVGAGPSVIAPGLVDRVDLFPAVYPARFGRHAGGIMAGETTPPRTVGRGEGQARVFDAAAMIEQPFAEGRGSVLLGGRYSYTGALLALVAPDYKLAYWDYQARAAYRISEHDRLSIFSFGAHDLLRNEIIARTLFHVDFHRLDLRWDHETEGGRVRVATTLGSDLTLKAAENSRNPGSSVTSRSARVRLELDQRVAAGARVRAGGDINVERFDEDREQQGPGVVPFGAHTDSYGGAWVDVIGRPSPGVEIVPGFLFDVFRVRDETLLAPEPRLSTRLKIAERVAWISAFGLTHQVPTFVIPVPGSNVSLFESTSQEVWQASQAIEASLPFRMLAKLTLFRNVIRLVDDQGRGDNYGVEVFVRRDFTERLGGFVSYTFSRADRQLFGMKFLSTFDRPHVLSVVLGYDLGAGFRAGSRFYLESGRPYEILCATPNCRDSGASPMPYQYVHSGRFPAFSRLDVRFEKKWTFESGAWFAATLEWFNALLSRELDSVRTSPDGLVFDGRSPLTLPSIGVEGGY